ncbi:MAG: TolC family protein [Leptospiraceae bacterium]|nr:TolC family protein [Leptospiraceae bacterium]
MKFIKIKIVIIILILSSSIFGEEDVLILDIINSEKIGIESSPEIRLISSQQEIKKLLVNENWRNYFPTATVRWDRNQNVIQNSSDSRNQRLTLNVDQVIYDGGRRDLSLKAAISDLHLAKYDLRIQLNKLRYKIRSLFYSILGKKAQIYVLEKSIKRQSEQLYFGKYELHLGESAKVQVLEVENRLNEIKLQHKNAQIEHSNLHEEFKILLRLKSATRLVLKGNILNSVALKYVNLPENDLIEHALKFRVEVDRTKAAEIQAESQYQYAKTYYIPTFSIGGFYGYRGDEYPPREKEWGVNFKMSMVLGGSTIGDSSNYLSRSDNNDRSLTSSTYVNLFDQLKYKREIISSGVAAYQARLNRKQINDIISTEVKKSLASYKFAWAAMEQSNENMKLFEKRLEIKTTQVKLGEARRTELAETEIRYLEAKNAQIMAILKYMTSVAELEIATGMSLDDLGLIKIN